MTTAERIEEVKARVAGQEFSAKGLQLNTFFSLIAAFASVAFGVWLVAKGEAHSLEASTTAATIAKAISEQTVAIKEQTTVQREGNCLLRFDTKDRISAAENCRQVAR